MLTKLRMNKKGFTLIELMIVIAIIGILAAIAIPNFISYRNKAYCGEIENDASSTLAAISSYFAVATHSGVPTAAQLQSTESLSLNGAVSTVTVGGTVNGRITITVQNPASNPCPKGNTFYSYMGGMTRGGWSPNP